MRFFIFVILLVITIQSVTALDTLTLESCGKELPLSRLREEVCQKLANSNFQELSKEEQKGLVIALMTQGEISIYEKMAFVNLWNEKLELTNKPEDVNKKSATYINNAWLSINYIPNSFEENEIVYTTPTGTVELGYDYSLSKPGNTRKGTTCSCHSLTGQNCGTEYTIIDESTINLQTQTEKTSQGIGTHKLNYQINGEQTIEPELEIRNKIQAKHYKYVSAGTCSSRGCGWRGRRSKKRYKCTNNYQTTYTTYPLDIKETKTLSTYPEYSEEYELSYTDRYTEPKVIFEAEAPEYKLYLGKAILQKGKYKYTINYTHQPFNYLHIERQKDNHTTIQDAKIVNEKTIKTSPNNLQTCKLEIQNPFNKKIIDCEETSNEYTPKIIIKTDQGVYKKDEEINLEITITENNEPSTGTIKLLYGEEEKTLNLNNGKITTTLEPVVGETKIIVEYKEQEKKQEIYAYNTERYKNIFLFAATIAMLGLLIKAGKHLAIKRAI